MKRRRRVLSISHAYVVAQNRRLAAEMARVGRDAWEITALAPRRYRGDLRVIDLERMPDEPTDLRSLRTFLTSSPHLFTYAPAIASILREGWDYVHMWQEPYILAGCEIAALAPRSASLVVITAQNIPKRYPPPFRQTERFVMRRASGWVGCGQTVIDAKRDALLYRDRPFSVIPLGVDVEAFAPNPSARAEVLRRLGWSDGPPPIVGFTGRLVPEKGVSFLMSVLEQLPVQWRTLIVGGGPLEADVLAWVRRRGDQARLVTGVTHDEIPAYLNAMDVLCAPSETTSAWREQFGRMIVEAFACGVPVLGSDSGEVPFTIGDGGLVAPERDAARWTSALTSMVGDPALRRELAARGRERALRCFDWRVVARRTLDFMETLPAKSALPE